MTDFSFYMTFIIFQRENINRFLRRAVVVRECAAHFKIESELGKNTKKDYGTDYYWQQTDS